VSRRPDEDLRGLFAAARRADEEKAPPFRRVLEGGAGRRFAQPRWIGWACAVACGAVAVAISTWSLHRPPEIPPGRIEAWTPPTEFLLDASFTELFDTVPTLLKPVPDYSPLLAQEKGTKP